MIRHPEGLDMTQELMTLSSLSKGRILDMGAGDGETVAWLQARGYEAIGLDLEGVSPVMKGDFTQLPFPDDFFDGVISECCFSVCQSPSLALAEAYRVLQPGGQLLLSDVFFHRLPTGGQGDGLWCHTREQWEDMVCHAGFSLCHWVDKTEPWRSYFLERLWSDDPLPCNFGGKSGYFLLVGEKR